MHTQAMCLHNCHLAININHKTRHAISLAMHQSITVSRVRIHKTQSPAHRKRSRNLTLPPMLVNLLALIETQNTNRNRAHSAIATSQEIPTTANHIHQITLLNITNTPLDCTRKNPRMATLQ